MESLFLPTRARRASTAEQSILSTWINALSATVFRALRHRSFLSPVYMIVIVAALVSTTYVHFLGSGHSDLVISTNVDWTSLMEGSRQLQVGAETGWKWENSQINPAVSKEVDHWTLLTFVHLDFSVASCLRSALLSYISPLSRSLSVTELPSTADSLPEISQGTTLKYSMPYDQAAQFLAKVQELETIILTTKNETARHEYESAPRKEKQIWSIKTTKTYASKSSAGDTIPVQVLGNTLTSNLIDPSTIASSSLDAIFEKAKSSGKVTVVTILAPIEYARGRRVVDKGESDPSFLLGTRISEEYGYDRAVDGLLEMSKDRSASGWIILALAFSVIFHGYLFNKAVRSNIKDPIQTPHESAIDPDAFYRAQRFSDSVIARQPGLPAFNSDVKETNLPPTPADTDDEDNASIIPRQQANLLANGQPATSPASLTTISRTQVQMQQMLKEKRAFELTDRELVDLSLQGKIAGYALESMLGDTTRAVKIRRSIISRTPATAQTTNLLESSLLPYENYDFDRVLGACCENVIGYLPLPLGVAGPITIDAQDYFIPMATTEGVLVASTSRGSKAINAGGGVTTVLVGDGMTRGPCISFDSLARAGAAKVWLDSPAGQKSMADAFNSTSRFAQLQSITTALAGTYLYPRFKTTTGDAMGMNMISKGVEYALNFMASAGFDDMEILSVSGNMCTDKKAAAINWINGRGKSVVAEAVIPADIVRTVLKCDVDGLVELNIAKNLVGSALAGAMGGFNAHAANIVAAVFLATGQDPAQVVESANCITLMKKTSVTH